MTPLEELVDSYREDALLARRVSPKTLEAYLQDMKTLCRQAGDLPPQSLKAVHIRGYVADEGLAGRAPASLSRMLSAWRALFAYAQEHNRVDRDPTAGVRAPRRPRTLPKALAPEEMTAMLDAPAQDAVSSRDQAMFELMYSSGLRVGELVGLLEGDVDREAGMVRVRKGKGGKERDVPVGAAALSALARWMRIREGWRAAGDPAGQLFVSRRGRPLTTRAVQLRMKVWCARAGVQRDVTPHQLRHSCATHLLQSSGDIRQVQEMLGHENLATTQIYTHLDSQALAKVYDRAHPRARAGRKPG